MILYIKIYLFIGIIAAIYCLFTVYSKAFEEEAEAQGLPEVPDSAKITLVMEHLFLWPKVVYEMITWKGPQ